MARGKVFNTLNGVLLLIVLCITLSIYVFAMDTQTMDNENNELNQKILTNLENFSNQNYQDVVFKERRDKLLKQIKRFKVLDLPININDNGNLCQDWKNDPKKRFPNSGNVCQLVDNDAICIDKNKNTTRCNKVYNRQIRELGIIDINQLTNTNFNNLIPIFKEVDKLIAEKELILHNLTNQIIQLKNIRYQQEYFLDTNKNYLLNSKNRRENIENKFELESNKNNINQNKFTLYKLENDKLIKSNDKYSKYLMISLIILVLITIVFFLSTRI